MYTACTTLLRFWGETLKLFVPRHGKLFWLVTLKTLSMALAQGWMLWAGGIGILVLSLCCVPYPTLYAALVSSYPIASNSLLSVVWLWLLRAVGIWSIILIVRPSLYVKNYTYYISYLRLLGIIFCCVVLFHVVLTISMLFSLPWIEYLFEHQFAIYYIPFLIVLCFRAADTGPGDGHLKEIVQQTSRIVLYNYPFLCIIACISLGGYVIMHSFLEYSMSWCLGAHYIKKSMEYGIFFSIFLCFVCIVCNVYIQQVHAHFDVYIRPKRRSS